MKLNFIKNQLRLNELNPYIIVLDINNSIFIDDKQIFVEDWSLTILQFAELLNISIPRFCYHDKLSIAGNCRMCMVESNTSFKPVIACASSLIKKMKLYMHSFMVKKARENVIEFLLLNHPLDCPICDQGSECDLQDQTLIFGSDRGRFIEIRRSVYDTFNFNGPIIKPIMTRCIHCTRCIRFSDEVIGNYMLGTLGRGKMTEVGTYYDKHFIDELSGNVIDLCPVGALTSKSYAFKARAWELKSIESIDVFDSLGSNIRVDIKGNEIMRILPKRNDYLNNEWITDKIRFSYESLMNNRIKYPKLRSDKNSPFYTTSILYFFEILTIRISLHYSTLKRNNNIFSIELGNYFTSAKDYYLINDVFMFFGLKNILNFSISDIIYSDFRSYYLLNSDINSFENNNLYLLNNINLKKENPIMNSKLKKLKINNGNNINISYIGPNINLNYDFTHLSNNSFCLLDILEGKHFYSILISQNKKNKLINGINYLKNNNFNKFNKLLNNSNISISNILPTSSLITLLDIGYNNNNQYYNNIDSKIYYLYNVEKLKNNYKNSVELIYHGTNISDEFKKIATFILPSTSIYEEKLIFSNMLGFTQTTNASLTYNSLSFINIEFLFLNLKETINKLMISKQKSNNLLYNINLNYFNDFYPYIKTNNYFISKIFFLDFDSKLLFNYKFNSEFIYNYYSTDNISFYSYTLQKCSLIVNEKKNNFFKNLIIYEYII